MSTSMHEALEEIRSLSEHGVNNPDEALSQVSSLCDAALSSPAPAGAVSEEELALAICHARFGDHVLADRPSFTEEARALLSQFDVRRK